MEFERLKKTAVILLIIVLVVVILVYGKPFLVPLAFAFLLAGLLFPIVKWLERKRVNRAVSILCAMLVLLSFFAGLFALLGWQASGLGGDTAKMESQITMQYQQAQQYITKTLGIPEQKQNEMISKQQESAPGKMSGMVTGIMAGIGGFITDFILILVYIFLLLYFRGHIKRFVVRVVPDEDENKTLDVIHSAQKVTQKYLAGMAIMIVGLWVMYGIGFSIAGVKNPLFFAVLCGLLEIVPFIGNIVGTTITIVMSLVQGGGTNVIIGILITYGLVQFIQTYILEPLVVGAEVNLNPLFTILALVGGEMLWGISGMILAIPIMGITKIVCDHIEPLKPFGQLIGEDEKKAGNTKRKLFNLFSKDSKKRR